MKKKIKDCTFKEFTGWANARACDGRWSMLDAMNSNLMADFSKDIAQGKVKVKNINDFERLVKLDMLLMGEATERVERGGTQELSQDAKDRLDEIAQLMKSAKK